MIRKFNYTDRKKILRDNIFFTWLEGENGKPASFKAKLDLKSTGIIRSDAQVWVEAYSGSNASRYYFGTIEQPLTPENTSLADFPRGLKPHFRIKIVDPDAPHKRLLAFVDKISPIDHDEIESGRRSILPVEYVDLGQQIWNLRMDESLQPVLQLNSSITEPVGITTLARSAEFVSLVYPAVIRQILARLILETDDPCMATDHNWLLFGKDLLFKSCPDRDTYSDDEEDFQKDAREWIDEVIEEFCRTRLAKDIYVIEKKEAYQDA
ncbi:MAG: hypothetical protein ACSHYA_18140 [Opitutaceae bacterium]